MKPDQLGQIHDKLTAAAAEVDAAECLPIDHRALLRDSGLYGVVANAPPQSAIRDAVEVGQVITSGCLTTGFVWGQHQGALARLRVAAESNWSGPDSDRLRSVYPDLAAGTREAGIVYSGWPSHGMSVEAQLAEGGDLVLNGVAPFVTGWPWIDVLVLYAYERERDTVACLVILDPREALSQGVADRLSLIAANASATHRLTFSNVQVARDKFIYLGRRPAGESTHTPVYVREYTSVLALGVLLGIGDSARSIDQGFAAAVCSVAGQLSAGVSVAATTADEEMMDRLRGQLLHAAESAAGGLVKLVGSKAVLRGSDAERRVREAAFVQVASTSGRDRAAAMQLVRSQLKLY